MFAFLQQICQNENIQEFDRIEVSQITEEINKGLADFHEISADEEKEFLEKFKIDRKKAIKK